MSAETVAFAELVRAAVNYTRLWCQHCQAEQMHQPWTERTAGPVEYWRCCRCGLVQNWKMP